METINQQQQWKQIFDGLHLDQLIYDLKNTPDLNKTLYPGYYEDWPAVNDSDLTKEQIKLKNYLERAISMIQSTQRIIDRLLMVLGRCTFNSFSLNRSIEELLAMQDEIEIAIVNVQNYLSKSYIYELTDEENLVVEYIKHAFQHILYTKHSIIQPLLKAFQDFDEYIQSTPSNSQSLIFYEFYNYATKIDAIFHYTRLLLTVPVYQITYFMSIEFQNSS